MFGAAVSFDGPHAVVSEEQEIETVAKKSSDYLGVKRSIETKAHGYGACVKVTATVGGRKKAFEVCAIGQSGQPSLAITRGGRRGGIRASEKSTAGMTVCEPGQGAKCLRTKTVFVFPGGGARLRKAGANVLNGFRKRKRK